jgi:hypothetical protein
MNEDVSDKWYIVKSSTGTCEIISNLNNTEVEVEKWGPYNSREDAIAHRIGLIRGGKCQPQ